MQLSSVKLCLISGLSFFTLSATADPDVANGAKLAEEWCTRCHDISATGAPKQYPPTFAAISRYRSTDQIYGRIVYPPLHSSMPEVSYMFSPGNIQDLVAYIDSLDEE